MNKVNLLNFHRHALEEWFITQGEQRFRAQQVLKWLYQVGTDNIAKMSNLSKPLREKLTTLAEIKYPEIALEHLSADGTYKWLLRLDDGNCIEMVFIPEANRGTLCISSQVGCALDCRFCSTAQQGFNRNLTVAEIVSQVVIASRMLGKKSKDDRIVSNIVLMGMGEPLLNFDNVVNAIDIFLDDCAYGLSKRRVTLSTSGIVPALKRLREVCDVSLAISLHAANNTLRDELVPINKKYPIEALLGACRYYLAGENTHIKKVTIEYVMLEGINDSPADAKALIKILNKLPVKVNLIPFNVFPSSVYRCSSQKVINTFRDMLIKAGIVTITRKTRGEDIDAACGQLAGKFKDKTKRNLVIERM